NHNAQRGGLRRSGAPQQRGGASGRAERSMMMLGLQQVIDGVALGGAYALAALGLALIYRVMRFIQLSHGQLVTLGAYVGWWASSAMGSLTAAFLVTAAAMAAFGAVLYLSLFKRMLGYSHLSPLMVALG